ncbi:MAG TPA: hypothetical protein VFX18_01280 [Candidatus Nitrosocosmicus sp.]|nr:hypothetical protein [Candidatus Nitrosocosmicus sp.]
MALKFSFKVNKDKKTEDNLDLRGIFSEQSKTDNKKPIKERMDTKEDSVYQKEISEKELNAIEKEDTTGPSQKLELDEDSIDGEKAGEEEQHNRDQEERCNNCKEKVENDWKKPNWKWNMDKDTKLCLKCYSSKEKEYEKLLNYCAICNSKLKFFRYNPKPRWKLKGQLCRKCWDLQNNQQSAN